MHSMHQYHVIERQIAESPAFISNQDDTVSAVKTTNSVDPEERAASLLLEMEEEGNYHSHKGFIFLNPKKSYRFLCSHCFYHSYVCI